MVQPMNELCCQINPTLSCEACGFRMCEEHLAPVMREAYAAAAKMAQAPEHIGPLFHEKGQCSSGANKFTIEQTGTYRYWKE